MDPFNFDNSKPRMPNDPADLSGLMGSLLRPKVAPKPKGGVLGLLGDFLMEQTGLAGTVRRRNLKAIMPGIVDDPEETIRQAARYDPELAARLQAQLRDDERMGLVADSNVEARRARTSVIDEKRANERRTYAQQYLRALNNEKDPEKKKAAYRQMLPKFRTMMDGDYFNDALPDEWDDNDPALGAFIGGAVKVVDQDRAAMTGRKQDHREYVDGERLEDADRGLDLRERTVDQGDARLGLAAQRFAASGGRSEGSGKAKPVMRYPGEDGFYYVEFDDGTVKKSSVKVRPTGKAGKPSLAERLGGSGPPPPRKKGDKIRGPGGVVLVSKDGKTWSK